MFETELNFFIKNQEKLVELYTGKTLILSGEKVIEVFDSIIQAYTYAKKNLIAGKYMIQPCEAGQNAYTVTISSSVIAA